MIPPSTLQQIQDRLDIAEVVGGYIPLKRAGRNFKALCPFHPEKTPSFMVYPQKQFFICYGCGAGGDLITFVMKHERMEFPEVVEFLAQKAGIPLAPSVGASSRGKDSGETLQAHEMAASFYQGQMQSSEGRQAREYLKSRGIPPESWTLFRLGYAPGQWDALLQEAAQGGLNPAVLERSGLAIPREGKQGWYDRFRNRIMFPICDLRGRVIAFGGRVLQDAEGPKYLNSPETELYIKGRVLYGLHLSAAEIREKDFCIVVEGYMDFVTPYQNGVRNVVASMGTSLTESQVRLIRRFTRHVVMVYDGDYAGQMATLRGLDLFLEAEMRVKVAALPKESDPDSLIRVQGLEAFARALQNSQELFDYKLSLLARQFDIKTLEGRIGVCQEMLPTIKRVPNALHRGEYVRRLAEGLGVAEGLLWTELSRTKLDARQAPGRPTSLERAGEFVKATIDAEGLLAGLLLEEPRRIQFLKDRLSPEQFQNSDVKQIVGWLLECWEGGILPRDHRDFLNRLPRNSEETEAKLVHWLAWADSIQEKDRVVEEVVERIRRNRRKASLDNLRDSLHQAEQSGDTETADRLVVEISQMLKTQNAGARE